MSFLRGAAYLIRGMHLLKQPGIRFYAATPILINLILLLALTVYLSLRLDALVNGMMPALPHWLQWLNGVIWTVAAVSAVVLSFFAVTLVANVIAAPFNEALAEQVEGYLAGHPARGAATPWFHGVAAAVTNALRKLWYFAVRAVPLLLLYLIPGVNVLAPILWLLFSAWMLALEYTDYPMANHGVEFHSQRRLLAGNRLLALGFGGAVLVLTAIPLANFFVMPAAVAGATALWAEQIKTRAGETHSRGTSQSPV